MKVKCAMLRRGIDALACICAGTYHRTGMAFTDKFQTSFVPPWTE